MKPLIAVLPNVCDDGKVSLADAYTRTIEKAGGIPLIVPYTEKNESVLKYIELADGVLLTGGGDVSPALYGKHSDVDIPKRDHFEFGFLKSAIDRKKPIMAICRGLQVLNVCFGGTLIEDIPTYCKSDILPRQSEGKCDFSHAVKVIADTPLSDLVRKESFKVNSFDHQAIDSIGKGLLPMAFADDVIIEAVFATGER